MPNVLRFRKAIIGKRSKDCNKIFSGDLLWPRFLFCLWNCDQPCLTYIWTPIHSRLCVHTINSFKETAIRHLHRCPALSLTILKHALESFPFVPYNLFRPKPVLPHELFAETYVLIHSDALLYVRRLCAWTM